MYIDERNKKYPKSIQLFASINRFRTDSEGTKPLAGYDGDRAICYFSHMHEALEILAAREGRIYVTIDGERCAAEPGDILVISPFEEHEIDFMQADRSVGFDILLLEPGFFRPGIGNVLDHRLSLLGEGKLRLQRFWSASDERTSALAEQISRMTVRYPTRDTLSGCCDLMIGGYQILSLLLDGEMSVQDRNVRYHPEFAKAVQRYVERHYAEELSTTDAAKAMGYNLTSFCRLFRRNFGMSFLTYLQKYRIEMAIREYRDSGMDIADIAAAVGISDPGYFWRLFRRQTGISPREYFFGKQVGIT